MPSCCLGQVLFYSQLSIYRQWPKHLLSQVGSRKGAPMCPGFDSQTLVWYVGWVNCWFSSLLWRSFSRHSSFPLSSKTNIFNFKFQFKPPMHWHFWTSSCKLLGAPWLNKLHKIIHIFFKKKSWIAKANQDFESCLFKGQTQIQVFFSRPNYLCVIRSIFSLQYFIHQEMFEVPHIPGNIPYQWQSPPFWVIHTYILWFGTLHWWKRCILSLIMNGC